MKNKILLIATILWLNCALFAQDKTPLEIKLGVYVIGINKISTQTSSYSMDFYLTLTCNRNCEKDKDYKFEIINGRIISSRLTDDQPNYKVYRINADLVSNFDFKMYPFEKPQLTLIIEDEVFDNAKLIYLADPEKTAIDEKIPNFGWQINKIEEIVGGHFYPNFNQTYSNYSFSIILSRPFWSAILKLLPAIAIMFACLMAIAMSLSIPDRGLTLISSSLVGSVLFHTNLAAGVPQVPYLTYADRFMLINYLITAICLLTVGVILLWQGKHLEKVEKFQKKARIVLPIVWLILQIGNAII
jgi:hypothetical protein